MLFAKREGLKESFLFFMLFFLGESHQDSARPATALGITSVPGGNSNPEAKLLQSVFLGIPHLAHKSQVHTGIVDYPQAGCLHRFVASFQLMTRIVNNMYYIYIYVTHNPLG